MNRIIFVVACLLGTSSLWLVDSAVKGTALLLLAAVATLFLRRDSAATRHLVWLLAIVAMLIVPVLSALLPQWRVLPEWANVSREPVVVAANQAFSAGPVEGTMKLPQQAEPVEFAQPEAIADQPVVEMPAPQKTPAPIASNSIPESAVSSRDLIKALPLVWAIGFSVLILRLIAARIVLWNAGRQGTVVWSSNRPAKERPASATLDAVVTALEAARAQLGIGRSVTLLMHTDKTIPVVWGIFHCHLLLPAAARDWNGEQLRSVLLHELAHIQRRDMLAQLLTQIACALHWFNPLAWFAAWRLEVERERACDDLVLASGVRPSAYAGHLLNVVTDLSSARWTHSCGLAMARKSSLEGRLVAVLGQNLNRRGVSVPLAAIGLAIAVGVAVPIAMLRAADRGLRVATGAVTDSQDVLEAESYRGTQEMNDLTNVVLAVGGGEVKSQSLEESTKPAQPSDSPRPKGKEAQSLFKVWQEGARTDGKIPGGALAPLARTVANFIKNNPAHKAAPKLAELQKRIDTSHDWTPAEAVALLDEVTAIYATLPEWVQDETRFSLGGDIQTGQWLPAELENAPWGDAEPNGLRMAWLLEPRAEQHRLGTTLKSRLLFHNSGKAAVVFRALTWNQSGSHRAIDAASLRINITSTHWTTLPREVACRLAPGEFLEFRAAGIGVGPNKDDEDWHGTRVGSWIEAQAGDEVTFLPAPVELNGIRGRRAAQPDDKPDWWLGFIQDRLSLDAPLPAAAPEREHLLRRAVRDLFGTAPTPEETAAFVADRAPDALEALAKRLAQRAGTSSFSGMLESEETRFRVLPVDPDAAKKPRVATGPGRYTIGDNVRLVIVQKPVGERRVNEANIVFFSPDPKGAAPDKPHPIKLPDGDLTWAIAWERGTTVLWVMESGTVRSYDFSDPARVQETGLEKPAGFDKVPKAILEALRAALDMPGASKQAPATPNNEGGVRSVSPPLEFRIPANLADSEAEPRIPVDFENRTYPENSVTGRTISKDQGFVWFKIANSRVGDVSLPVDAVRGDSRFALLADTPEHAMAGDGKWSVVESRVTPSPDGDGRFVVELTLNTAGGTALRMLTRTHLNQPLAIVVNGEIVAAPRIREEIGGVGVTVVNLTREHAEKLATALKAGRETAAPATPELKPDGKPPAATAIAAPTETIVAGRVLGAQDRPVRDAEVGLQVWGFDEQNRLPDSDFVATATTDAEGKFRLTVPATIDPKTKLGTVWALAEGYVPVRPTSYGGLAGLKGENVTIRLIPDLETVIRVLEQDGSPAADVRVRVSSQRLPESIGRPTPRRWTDRLRAATNKQGEARLAHARPDAIDGIILSRNGMADVWLDANFFLNVRPKAADPAQSGPAFTFQLPPTGGFGGRLIVEGAALPRDITIRIQTQSRLPNAPNHDAWGQADVPVDAEGRFQISGIAAGRVLILPFLPEDQPLRAAVPPNVKVPAGATTSVEIPVAPGVLVRGQIRKQDTQAGASQFRLGLIYGQSARDHSSMYETFELVTDDAGKFSAHVPPGPIELRLHSIPPGYQETEWWNPEFRGRWGTGREVPAGKAEFDLAPIDLDQSKPLKGRLVDADGEPLAHWRVYGYPDLPNKPRTESRMNSFGGLNTDQEGKFNGTYPATFPPAYWNVSHRDWPTPYKFADNRWDAKVLSTEPFVLQVSVRKADAEKGKKKEAKKP
ncbi:MAG TPA: M56 family metallopeptidase [Planctomycetaceae bacterium]|jgi:beta-lactamase regulating signal transducer with metallopeptidase domain